MLLVMMCVVGPEKCNGLSQDFETCGRDVNAPPLHEVPLAPGAVLFPVSHGYQASQMFRLHGR